MAQTTWSGGRIRAGPGRSIHQKGSAGPRNCTDLESGVAKRDRTSHGCCSEEARAKEWEMRADGGQAGKKQANMPC